MEAGSWSSIKADMEVAIGDTSTNYTKKGNSKRSMTGLSGKKTMMYSITTDLFIRILPYRIFTNKSTKNKLLV